MLKKVIMGADPGLGHFGLVIADFNLQVKEFHCIQTKKGKSRLAAEDVFLRGQQLAREIEEIINPYSIAIMCAESFSYPRNSSASAKMAIAWGIICALSERLKVPLVMDSPQNIKKTLTGTSKASKEDIQRALQRKGYKLPKMAKSKLEHPSDALSAIIGCKDTQIFRAIIGG